MLLEDLPKNTRPREKLLAMGSQTLTDAELLAVMLGTGLPGQNVLQLAHALLEHFHGLAGLLQASPADLRAAKGLGGSARRAQLLAVLELSRRVLLQKMRKRDVMNNPDTVKQFLQLQMGAYPQEVFAVVFMDAQYRLLSFQEMFKGTLNQTSVYPREVVKLALEQGAAAVILAHNHPSGDVRPSAADSTLTRTLQTALSMVDVKVLDHIIVGPGIHWSMAERSPW
ncbi:MAG: RadC family protein [Limnohabitans sp.]|jgi:DNA repair protein RadC|nr:DNA repair protein RadC [Burkholderiales bacterium]MCE2678759.1 DNA repair protein RadC [Burkholderiaceae bacterium]